MAEYEINLSHDLILNQSITHNVILLSIETVVPLTQTTADFDTNIDTVISILQTFTSNVLVLNIETVINMSHGFGENNTVLDWIMTMYIIDSLTQESAQTQGEGGEDSIGFDHVLIVTQESTKTISTTVNVKSEFGVFPTTVSDDYGGP